jgi:hypothetical protein
MKAYDHISKMLEKAAGDDGIVSREDADKLVSDLRKDGRGTEALAARNLFKMIDARDQGKGARVTGYDLDKTRGFVEQKMLENRDDNRNGFSQAEIAKMSPTGRALVELGQMLEVEKTGGRVAHRTPELGMEHIAKMLNEAGGPDKIVSRDDRDELLDGLYREGRGTEALAASYFFNFVDHRDYKMGARVTAEDLSKACDYAKDKLLLNKDLNKNGYSQDEIAKFSTTAKAFLHVGQMIEAGIIKADD